MQQSVRLRRKRTFTLIYLILRIIQFHLHVEPTQRTPEPYRATPSITEAGLSDAAEAAGALPPLPRGFLALGGADDVLAAAAEAPVPEAPPEAPHAGAGAAEVFVDI